MRFKILAVGNSFSVNALKHVYSILNSFGINEIVVGNLCIGGCSIETHYNNIVNNQPNYNYIENRTGEFKEHYGTTVYDALVKEDWDFITLQQVSGLSGKAESYDDKIDYIINYLKQNVKNKKVKFAWHMTWAYEQTADHPDFPSYDSSQLTMYNQIVQTVQEKICKNKKISTVIPSGTAIQNARTSYIGDTFTIDGYHLDDMGEFLTGLTYIKKLTNWDLKLMNWDLVPYRFSRYKEALVEAVINACKKPFEITDLSHLKNPADIEKVNFKIVKDLEYSDVSSVCKLDMYIPEKENYDTVIHFHGGGLSSGYRNDDAHIMMGSLLAERGVCFVSASYRMYPQYKFPDFLNDAASAIKYVLSYFKTKKGKIIISGQSAGAYMGMMLCFNNEYLNAAGVNNLDIDGWLIESGQPTTHYKILSFDNLNPDLQRIDERAPIYHINENTKFNNVCLIAYTRDLPMRKNQNILLYNTIKHFNNDANVTLRILDGLHCVNSTSRYRDYYAYIDLVIEYLKSL